MDDARTTGATLFSCLAASQAAVLVLTPVLAAAAADLGVSTAVAGQLRTVSGLSAGATALAIGFLAARVGLRELLVAGLAFLAAGAALSGLATEFAVIAAAQLLIGIGVGLSYSAGVAGVAEWTRPDERSRVLSIALLGPPLAWVVAMPICGVLGDVSWRLAWIVPLAAAVASLAIVARRKHTPPAPVRADLRAVLGHAGVLRWSTGELLAYSAWAGMLVFVGALFVESYGLSLSATGLVLGAAGLVYVLGNVVFRRFVDDHGRTLLVTLAFGAAAAVAVLGMIRPSAWFSFVVFSVLTFLAGGRTLAGSARGLDLAPALRLGVTGVRTAAIQLGYFVGAAVGGVALAAGEYPALGLVFAALFVGAAVAHLLPQPAESPSPLLR
jgi:DHA1 family inner membrane transport protein